MISWDRFWKEGSTKSIIGILSGTILSIFLFSLLLNDIASAAEPWDEPKPMVAMYKHIDSDAISISKDDPPPIPDPDPDYGGTLSTPPGEPEGVVTKPEASCRETVVDREGIALPWIVWFDLLMTLFK